MKKLYIVLSIFILLSMAGCKPGPYIVVSQSDYSFDYQKNTDTVHLETNVPWTTQTHATWITVTPTSGNTNNSTITFVVGQNKTFGERNGSFSIRSADGFLNHAIHIHQSQNDTLLLNYESFFVSSAGGTVSVNVIANVDFEVEVDCDWITLTKALSSKMVYLEVAPAPDVYSSREGKVYIKSYLGGRRYTKEVTITQFQDDHLAFSENSFDIPTEGRSFDVNVIANVPYRISIPSEYSSWVKEVSTKALDTTLHTFTIDHNKTYSWRDAYILLYGTTTSLSDTIKIVQDQTNYLQLEQDLIQFDSKVNTFEAVVNSNVDISYEILDGGENWLTLVQTKALSDSHYLLTTLPFAGSETEVFRSSRIAFYNREKAVGDTLTAVQTADGVYYVKMATPGTLSSYISREQYDDVEKLIFVGNARDNDFAFIRDNLRNLTHLDLSGLTNTIIPNKAFSDNNVGMPLLKRVILPPQLTTINQYAFAYCTKLKDISIPETVTNIYHYAFANCESLETITLPRNIRGISDFAFSGSGIKSISIPNSLTTISQGLFKNCKQLESVSLGNGVETIGIDAFMASGLKTVVVPASVTYIYRNAFYQCESLNTAILPEGLSNIESAIFAYCYSLTNVNIPVSLTTINNNMFRECRSLKTITIPSSITKIDYNAFKDCSEMAVLICECPVPPALVSDVFEGINRDTCELKVPAGYVDIYKGTYMWQLFINITEK